MSCCLRPLSRSVFEVNDASEAVQNKYELHPDMKLTMSLKDILSASKTKRQLTCMFAQGLLDHVSGRDIKLVVVYDTHEEADTLILNQVLASTSDDAAKEVWVWSPDTDVLVLLIDLVSCGRLGAHARLKILTGKSPKYRELDVV